MNDLSNNFDINKISKEQLIKEYQKLNSNFQRVLVEKENLQLENIDLNSINESLKLEKEELENRINYILDNISNSSQESDENSSNDDNYNFTFFNDKIFDKIKINQLIEIISLFKEIFDLLKSLNKIIYNFEKKISTKNQDEDDLIFYKSIIIDSKNYFIKSFKVRELKFLNDIIKIFKLIEPNSHIEFIKIDKNLLNKFKIFYGKFIRENKEAKINKNNNWIKKNKLKPIDLLNKEINRCFDYHKNIVNHFKITLEKEVEFFKIN